VIQSKQRTEPVANTSDARFIRSQENQSQSAGERVHADHDTEMNLGACSKSRKLGFVRIS